MSRSDIGKGVDTLVSRPDLLTVPGLAEIGRLEENVEKRTNLKVQL